MLTEIITVLINYYRNSSINAITFYARLTYLHSIDHMRNYIILTHKNADHIRRVIDLLDDGQSHFYIHVDQRKSLDEFKVLNIPIVTFVKERIHCYWADFSLVQATLNCIYQIIRDNRPYRTILMSGQCYPIANKEEIGTFFKDNRYDYMNIEPLSQKWPNSYFRRLEDYKIHISQKRGDHMLLPYVFNFKRNIFKTLVKYGILIQKSISHRDSRYIREIAKTFKKRHNPIKEEFGGCQWWALSGSTLLKMYNYLQNHPEYIQYHLDTLCPDEIFFHALIKHLAKEYKEIRIRPSITYVNWTRKNCNLPVTFVSEDLEEVLEQRNDNKLLCRKFEPNDPVLDLIDEAVHKKIKTKTV